MWIRRTRITSTLEPSPMGFWRLPRNILTTPGITSLDFALFKNFRITEAKRVQFRWEMYNSTNTPPFDPPGRTIGTGTFGQIASAGLGREMQFGLRFEF